jgi:PIN domain nuclease of toxin-antitoxin system
MSNPGFSESFPILKFDRILIAQAQRHHQTCLSCMTDALENAIANLLSQRFHAEHRRTQATGLP